MNKIWSAVATFNVLFLFNLWVMDRTNTSLIDVFNPSENWSSVPIFGLSLGTFTTIFSYFLMLKIIDINGDKIGVERMPSLWVENIEEQFRRKWNYMILVITLLFPMLAQVNFWFRFHKWQAWINDDVLSLNQLSLYEPVSLAFLLDWDGHRYGDFSKVALDGWHGVSFVPFWQPLIMIALSLVSIVYFAKIFLMIFPKDPR